MKQIIYLLLCLPFVILFSGCPMGDGSSSPCRTYDTLYYTIDSTKKHDLIYKGYETLKFVDINTFDTITFKGGPIIHGFDTIANTLNPGPEKFCDQIVILEYYKIKFTNINFEYEFFESKIVHKTFTKYSTIFYEHLIIDASNEDYFIDLGSLCINCNSIDSINSLNKKFYNVYKINLWGSPVTEYLYWNREFGVLNFPIGIIDNRHMVLHSVQR
jgi:hypothetical protein